MSKAPLPEFNRIVRRFADDLARPEYRAQRARNRALLTKMRRHDMAVREDPARDWEHCHVALHAKATLSLGAMIVDFGGGGSIFCYEMAASGFDVTVVDLDPQVCEIVNLNAENLGLRLRLRAIGHDGRSAWPLANGAVDAVVSISVFEALMRRQRTAFFSECRRVLKPRGELLLTFDFGEGARLVGDPICSACDLTAMIVEPSGLVLEGPVPAPPEFTADFPAPVRLAVAGIDGMDYETAAYTFGALRLANDATALPENSSPEIGGAPAYASSDPKELCREVLHHLTTRSRLRDLPVMTVEFEAWDEFKTVCWYWEISPDHAQQVDVTARHVTCVLSASAKALIELLRRPHAFWRRHYAAEFTPRGDLSAALRLVDRFPVTD